jgi:hypothetical protein
MKFYSSIAAKHPVVRFLQNGILTLDEAVAAADIVVCHDSGFGNDAVVKGCLVVVLDVLPEPLSNGQTMVGMGLPRATGEMELAEIVGRLFADSEYRSMVDKLCRLYAERYCSAAGVEAARNVAKVVKRHAVAGSAGGMQDGR